MPRRCPRSRTSSLIADFPFHRLHRPTPRAPCCTGAPPGRSLRTQRSRRSGPRSDPRSALRRRPRRSLSRPGGPPSQSVCGSVHTGPHWRTLPDVGRAAPVPSFPRTRATSSLCSSAMSVIAVGLLSIGAGDGCSTTARSAGLAVSSRARRSSSLDWSTQLNPYYLPVLLGRKLATALSRTSTSTATPLNTLLMNKTKVNCRCRIACRRLADTTHLA